MKVSIDKKDIVGKWEEKGCYASAPAFVADPNSSEEDEGEIDQKLKLVLKIFD